MSNYSDSTFDESSSNTSWYKVFQLVPEKASVLDIGCSSGAFGEVLIEKKQCHVDGIELNLADARIAKKKLSNVWVLNIETDNIDKIPHNKYDMIYFGDVIEHLVDPIAALQKVKSLLNKDGAILFSVPNMGHLGVRLALLRGDFDYTETGLLDKTHLHFYTQREVVRVFSEAGYAIELLDFVQKDYPRELLRQVLEAQGLQPDEKFFKNVEATSASAFQFIGIAKRSNKPHKTKLPKFGPIDLFENFYNDTVKGYETRIASLEEENGRLKTQLDTARQALAYRQRHPYRSVAGHLKRKLKD